MNNAIRRVIGALLFVCLSSGAAIAQTQPQPTPTDLINQLQITLDKLRASVLLPVRSVSVRVGESIQAAVDAAPDGTEIRIAPGAYSVNLILRAGKNGIVIRTDVPDPVLTLPWVTPAIVAGKWATLTPADPLLPVVRTEAGAHDYLLTLLEIGPNLAMPDRALLYLGDFAQTTLDQVPSHIDIDRCYIHGSDAKGGLRGLSLNTRNSIVTANYFSNFWFQGSDSQAIGIYTGPGPYLIRGNYLEGSGENLMVGGVDTKNADMIPSDIVITGNYFFKPPAWRPVYSTNGVLGNSWVSTASTLVSGKPGSVKNLLELKNARRVLIEYNVLVNSWIDSQSGHGVVFTIRDQDGKAPWSTVTDVVARGNVIRNIQGSAFNLLGLDDTVGKPSVQGLRLTIDNNLILVAGRAWMTSAGYQPTTLSHNTAQGIVNATLFLYGVPFTSGQLTMRDNVLSGGLYGVIGDAVGIGTPAFATFAPQPVIGVNVLDGIGAYPVGFVILAPGTLAARLDAKWHYLGPEVSSDGKPMGADVDEIYKRIPWLDAVK